MNRRSGRAAGECWDFEDGEKYGIWSCILVGTASDGLGYVMSLNRLTFQQSSCVLLLVPVWLLFDT
jgi:hypothetical protein